MSKAPEFFSNNKRRAWRARLMTKLAKEFAEYRGIPYITPPSDAVISGNKPRAVVLDEVSSDKKK